ncbi:AmmeMemoRadiSam system protein A [Aliikangiella marina]|uniref:AmmeMemoRadiSam system protein A n=1 Tax=Aliikangiella marina TaxID=1712262 RepID=A0A545THK0_9GAMM|nr:AmmeMemoRadiSam system protein A [Aliikangiella marina]TQV76707.1 AmmeMemoRadiSam system protein A [Aliikangiella marina]
MPFTKLTQKDKQIILQTARHAIQYGLTYSKAPILELNSYSETLQQIGACFVTLKETNQLRGCIGGLEAKQPLIQDVADHAFAAAFKDPRFPKVNPIEEPMIHISVSILMPAEAMTFSSEADCLNQLVPGEDGLVLRYNGFKATFLPTVWEQLPEPQSFINHLKKKAGLSESFWSDEIEISRYKTINID